MELESWRQPGRGRREYFRRVADACGSGAASSDPGGGATTEDFFELLSDYAVVRMRSNAG